MALNREIQEYARAVAEAVFDECYDEWGLEGGRRKQVDLDAIIASVPPPTAQHHAAPTCDGWWWARHSFNRRWEAVLYVYDGNQEEPEQYVVLNGQEEGRDVSEFDAWVGPLLPPDTTEPAPDVQVSPPSGTIGGARKALEYLEHIIARDHFDLAPLALRALELEVATMRGEMRTKRQTWPRTQDVPDISTWRQCGGGDSFATIEAEGKVLATIITDGGDTQPIAGRVLRTILKLREQPAPDVQAQIDAAVARERKVIEARLRQTAECYPQSSDGRNTFLLEADWVRARSAKGV